jgi:hypothetical protein
VEIPRGESCVQGKSGGGAIQGMTGKDGKEKVSETSEEGGHKSHEVVICHKCKETGIWQGNAENLVGEKDFVDITKSLVGDSEESN